jgi:hypothetical protein
LIRAISASSAPRSDPPQSIEGLHDRDAHRVEAGETIEQLGDRPLDPFDPASAQLVNERERTQKHRSDADDRIVEGADRERAVPPGEPGTNHEPAERERDGQEQDSNRAVEYRSDRIVERASNQARTLVDSEAFDRRFLGRREVLVESILPAFPGRSGRSVGVARAARGIGRRITRVLLGGAERPGEVIERDHEPGVR